MAERTGELDDKTWQLQESLALAESSLDKVKQLERYISSHSEAQFRSTGAESRMAIRRVKRI